MRNTIANTRISCTVTNANGTDSGNIQMDSWYVMMLEGKWRLRGCYLDDYVKNVRAKAETSLKAPEGAILRRILSIDSDPALSEVEGASVQFFDGWSEEILKSQEQVCLVSHNRIIPEDGFITITDDGIDGIEKSARLRVIGTVTNVPDTILYCPFHMPWKEGTSEAFPTDNCSFDIRDNQYLEESKEYLYQWFVRPGLSIQADAAYGVLVHDEIYLKNIAEIQANLSMLRMFLPILILLCCCIGFFASFLTTRGRTKEFAVMRCLGMKQSKIFALVMAELAVLALVGLVLGITGGILLEGNIRTSALSSAALMTGLFLFGSAIAVIRGTRINVMKLMKVED